VPRREIGALGVVRRLGAFKSLGSGVELSFSGVSTRRVSEGSAAEKTTGRGGEDARSR
jgi:hypothetical protein